MTNHRALTFSSVSAIAACLLLAAPAAAQDTNCQPGDLFCAELHIGPGRAGIRIGGSEQAPPPVVYQAPPVYQVEPQPPVVVVQPAPMPEPQPPVVVVQPQYPQQQYYVQQPQPQYVPQQQYYVQQPQPEQEDRFPYSSMGVHLHLDGIAADNVGMGGAGAALRIRPIPHIALDIGGGVYGGVDYNGLDRVEIPLSVEGRFFFNPQHRFQFYALVQLGASVSHAEGVNRFTRESESRDYFHLGGGAGFGAEWRLARSFALNLDVRGFLRQRADDNSQAEFTEPSESGGWQSTDLSGGFVGQFGATFYWGT